MEYSGPVGQEEDRSSSRLDRFQTALDDLASLIPESDPEKHLTVTNSKMWVAIHKGEGDAALEQFESLIEEAQTREEAEDETVPQWLTRSLMGASWRLGHILGDDFADEALR